MTAPYTDRTDEINAKVKARAAELKRLNPKMTDFDCYEQAVREIINALDAKNWQATSETEKE